MAILRIALDGKDFKTLVSGRTVVVGDTPKGQLPVEIILSDIGFEIMRHYIYEAEREQRAQESPSSNPPVPE